RRGASRQSSKGDSSTTGVTSVQQSSKEKSSWSPFPYCPGTKSQEESEHRR
ncbi:unnamed protein product, partial [Heterotrigona itama]